MPALSAVLLSAVRMVRITAQNAENHLQERSAPSDSTAVSSDVSAPQVSPGIPMPDAGLSSPLAAARAALPAHLEPLADQARAYVAAASAANTRRAYVSDWTHFCGWCRRQAVSPLPPSRRHNGGKQAAADGLCFR
jgi:hypothetical protein